LELFLMQDTIESTQFEYTLMRNEHINWNMG
jgi:hypothetical protein